MTDQREEKLVIKDKKYALHYNFVDINYFNSNWLKVERYHWFDYDVYNISYFERGREEIDTYNFPILILLKCLTIAFTESNKGFLYGYESNA